MSETWMFDSTAVNRILAAGRSLLIRRRIDVPLALSIGALVAFYLSIKPGARPFDYTWRIADAFLKGRLGLCEQPPGWLGEVVPLNGSYYSVFPLGAVLSVMPLALFGRLHVFHDFPGRGLAAFLAGGSVLLFFQLSTMAPATTARRCVLALFPIFATWTWCNLGFGGAWQIALGFALLGEAGALYFTLVRPRPAVAGTFFAIAFGNRTELLLTAPLFAYLWAKENPPRDHPFVARVRAWFEKNWRTWARFFAVPVVLTLATAAYNFARFGSPFDFGYTRLPGVTLEPGYYHGLFSFQAIPSNALTMLVVGMRDLPRFPFLAPHPFGCSIFLASPFLFLLFREGGRYRVVCWIAIGVLTFALWCHGNPGGFQFSYRYAMILLPWMFLLILNNGPTKLRAIEASLFAISVAINAIVTYEFYWGNQIQL
jgi:hypothetical protein